MDAILAAGVLDAEAAPVETDDDGVRVLLMAARERHAPLPAAPDAAMWLVIEEDDALVR